MIKSKKLITFCASILITGLTVFLQGIIVNTQYIPGLSTVATGFPFTWFNYYLGVHDESTLSHMLSNFDFSNIKIDLFVFVTDVILIYLFLCGLLRLKDSFSKRK